MLRTLLNTDLLGFGRTGGGGGGSDGSESGSSEENDEPISSCEGGGEKESDSTGACGAGKGGGGGITSKSIDSGLNWQFEWPCSSEVLLEELSSSSESESQLVEQQQQHSLRLIRLIALQHGLFTLIKEKLNKFEWKEILLGYWNIKNKNEINKWSLNIFIFQIKN